MNTKFLKILFFLPFVMNTCVMHASENKEVKIEEIENEEVPTGVDGEKMHMSLGAVKADKKTKEAIVGLYALGILVYNGWTAYSNEVMQKSMHKFLQIKFSSLVELALSSSIIAFFANLGYLYGHTNGSFNLFKPFVYGGLAFVVCTTLIFGMFRFLAPESFDSFVEDLKNLFRPLKVALLVLIPAALPCLALVYLGAYPITMWLCVVFSGLIATYLVKSYALARKKQISFFDAVGSTFSDAWKGTKSLFSKEKEGYGYKTYIGGGVVLAIVSILGYFGYESYKKKDHALSMMRANSSPQPAEIQH